MEIEFKKMESFVVELVENLRKLDGYVFCIERRWMERIVGMIIGLNNIEEDFKWRLEELEYCLYKEIEKEIDLSGVSDDFIELEMERVKSDMEGYKKIVKLIEEMKKFL